MSGSVIKVEMGVNALAISPVVQKVSVEFGVFPGPPGPPGQPGANVILNETPSGVIDGSNTTFTTANNFVPESLCVQVNGLAQKPIDHFITIGSNTFDMNESPQVGDFLLVCYQEA